MTDLEIVKEIEKELEKKVGINLIQVVEIGWKTRGYTLNTQNNVTGLGLNGLGITKLELFHPYFKKLKHLKRLSLSNNKLDDITVLKDLKDLTELNLSQNELTDISVLKYLTNLTRLELYRNHLKDISALQGLIHLKLLDISSNKLTDISSLKSLLDKGSKIYSSHITGDGIYLGGQSIEESAFRDYSVRRGSSDTLFGKN